MKRNILQLLTILLLMIVFLGTSAQDHRTLDTKIADILTQMPTQDLVHRDRVMAEIIELGPEGFQKFSGLLVPPGTGDDTAVRFALNSVARYVSGFGKENIKGFVETQLLSALESHTDTEVKTFLLDQLNLVAGDKTVDTVKKYLTEKELTEPATQTLTQIGSEKAARTLLEALPKAEDEASKTTLVRALGVLQYRQAADVIAHFTETENPGLKKAALAALAGIGTPDSYSILYNAAKDVEFAYEATNAAEAFLNYADKLGEENQTELCKKACKAIFKANQSGGKLHNRSKALAIYSKYYGFEALPLLLKAVESRNKSFRCSALNLAEKMDDIAATRAWIEKAKNSSEEIKAEIIDMLGRKGDVFAVGFIKENLNSTSPKVREESITALAKLQEKKVTPVLNPMGLSDQEISDGFVSLFNGKNLNGWQGNTTDYYVGNGQLIVNPEHGGHGNLFTEKEYSDFIFRFDFQLTPGANNGLGIRAPLEGDAAYVGMELQILDNTDPIYANLHEYQYHGSVYGVIPAKRGFLNPVGEWNSQEVIVQGSRVKVILNGETILDGDIKEAGKNGTIDGNEHPGLTREKGYIGFLGHDSELKFKNIRIKELPGNIRINN